MASLDLVREKLFRAAEHAKSLEAELLRYFETNPGKVVLEPNSPPDNPVFNFVPKEPIPTRFGIIVGDCLQNLRSSVDYLVWELVLAANNQPGKDDMFPICSRPELFKKAVSERKRLEGVHPDAATEIEGMQPYHLGKNWKLAVIAVIDDIANTNKHRRVPITMLRAARTDDLHTVEIDGELWTHGTVGRFDENAKIALPIRPGQVEMQAQLFAAITFDEGAAKGMEVSTCLNIWMRYVLQDVIPLFERFF